MQRRSPAGFAGRHRHPMHSVDGRRHVRALSGGSTGGRRRSRTRPTTETVVRVSADALMVNASLVVALAAHVPLSSWDGTAHHAGDIIALRLRDLAGASPPLTICCLSTFLVSGLYAQGRTYSSWHKSLLIMRAVALAYVLYGFARFFFARRLGMPHAAYVGSWAVTTTVLVASRLCMHLWDLLRLQRPTPTDVRKEPPLVLVIGGAGYIGSALVPQLLAEGYRVRVLDLLLYGTGPLERVRHDPHLEVIVGDFRSLEQLVRCTSGVSTVVHLGGIVGDPACALDERLTTDINLMSTRTVAEVARMAGVSRLVFASTCSVYGANDEVLDERSQLRPLSLYAKSKAASEQVLLEMRTDSFTPVILRFATIYGVSGRQRFDLVVNLFAANAVVEREIQVVGGDQWRPFLHVRDAAKAVVAAVVADRLAVDGEVFNVGADEDNLRIADLAALVQARVPGTLVVEHDLPPGDRRNYRVAFGKVRRSLGYVPDMALSDGIDEVVQLVRSGAVHDYHDSAYSNLRFLVEEGLTRLSEDPCGWAYARLSALELDEPPCPPVDQRRAAGIGTAPGDRDPVADQVRPATAS